MAQQGSKAKGSNAISLHGKTGEPIPGEIQEVWSKKNKFDHDNTECMAWKVLYKAPDGTLKHAWFNTYKEVDEDGNETPAYVGEKVSLETNSTEATKGADGFRAKATEKGYTLVEDEADYPPQCGMETEEEAEPALADADVE